MSPPDGGPARDNLRGAAWLMADMSLNIWALSLVKLSGADIPAAQMVFLRAVVGLVVLAPWLWAGRRRLRPGPVRLHLARVGLSATALGTSFFAIAQVPFALFTGGYRKAPVSEVPHDWSFDDHTALPGWMETRITAAQPSR